MTRQKTKTWTTFLLALLLNFVWALGGELVLCMRNDGAPRVELRTTHGVAEAHHGCEHEAEECIGRACDDVPLGQNVPSAAKGPLAKRFPVASPPCFPVVLPPAHCGPVHSCAEPGARSSALFHLRTIVLLL